MLEPLQMRIDANEVTAQLVQMQLCVMGELGEVAVVGGAGVFTHSKREYCNI